MKQLYTIDDLVKGCQRGERKAQESLYRAVATKMFNICLRYAGSEVEAEDILQNGFIKVFQSVSSFRGEGSFEGWIRRIFVNTAIETIRKNKQMQYAVSVDQVFEEEQPTFDMDGLEVRDLLRIIQQLPDGYRMIFNMYAIEGYSHKEIADALNISEGASKSQLSRARAWLKSKLIMLERGDNYGSYAG